MTTETPSFELFLYKVSSLTSTASDPRELLTQIIKALHDHWGNARVPIRLRTSSRGRSHILSLESPPQRRTSFVFSQAIAVRGREYGHLAVETKTPVGSPPKWMPTRETLGEQLALYAKRLGRTPDREQVKLELAGLQETLRTRKAPARGSEQLSLQGQLSRQIFAARGKGAVAA